MKRMGHIYERVYALDNIKQAVMSASLGKRNQNRVKRVIDNIDIVAKRIQEMLVNKTYEPSPYIVKTIYDGANKKVRNICSPRF